jgi:gluconate 2-dehydrogenase gamma chain
MTHSIDRRSLVKVAGAAGIAAAFPNSTASTLPSHLHAASQPSSGTDAVAARAAKKMQAYVFLNSMEANFIEAAVAVFIPADDLGPGAVEAGVPYYIDRQLAGAFGSGARMYLQGPFAEGLPQQGYQLPLTPAQVYRLGIEGVNNYCREHFAGRTFDGLSFPQQEVVLNDLDHGRFSLSQLSGSIFLNLLLSNTFEGFFGDPAYGGNRGGVGWKLVGFPGAYAMFEDKIEAYRNKAFTEAPVSLLDLQ